MTTRILSKSKLIAFRQCPKRLWLEVYQPRLRVDSRSTEAIFRTGNEVGEIARQIYDPDGVGSLVDLHVEGVKPAIERTRELVKGYKAIFEAGFSANGAMAFADVLLPMTVEGAKGWRMVEVKSSTSVKAYHEDDIAIQSYIARAAGLPLFSVSLAHIDTSWIYQGDENYQGLLVEKELTDRVFARFEEVQGWIDEAHTVAAMRCPPNIAMGKQCTDPFPCGFSMHCKGDSLAVEYPVEWLPRVQSKVLKTYIAENAVLDMRDVPDKLLNEQQRRVQNCTVSAATFFDRNGAMEDLAKYPPPAMFLDFETTQFGVPRWAGTRPFQSLPFQFSLHKMETDGGLVHTGFLDLTGGDPTYKFATALVAACTGETPIFVYNASFEGSRISELAQKYPDLKDALSAIRHRLVDLRPIAEKRFYHPSQQGSWSIKKVLPAVNKNLCYESLSGVQDGDAAMQAYLEAIAPTTTPERRGEIHKELVDYCKLDTLAMVHIWKFFKGQQ